VLDSHRGIISMCVQRSITEVVGDPFAVAQRRPRGRKGFREMRRERRDAALQQIEIQRHAIGSVLLDTAAAFAVIGPLI
jgi:hypothetical protein